MMAQPSLGDTVNPTNSNNDNDSTINEQLPVMMVEKESSIDLPRLNSTRKRRRDEFTLTTTTTTTKTSMTSSSTEVPEKTQRRSNNNNNNEDEIDDDDDDHKEVFFNVVGSSCPRETKTNYENSNIQGQESNNEHDVSSSTPKIKRITHERVAMGRCKRPEPFEENDTKEIHQQSIDRDTTTSWPLRSKRKKNENLDQEQSRSFHSNLQNNEIAKRLVLESRKKDEGVRLRKTIQWLDEGARRLREDLANVRMELHEERRAAKIAKREADSAVRDARSSEAAKYQLIITDLKNRLSRSISSESPNRTSSPLPSSKAELVKNENHRRELLVMKRRLTEAETKIKSLKWGSLNQQSKQNCRNGTVCFETGRLEIRTLRVNNEKLEEKLRTILDAAKARTNELRIQHEAHEAELTGLRKSFRSETIRLMDELKCKTREIERLSKLVNQDTGSRKRRRIALKEDVKMRKLKENSPIRSKKYFMDDGHVVDSYIREVGCDGALTEVEVERLRELALEQQEVIEILRQAVKEKERKLEQLSNKKRKEEFYRQWLELEPVAEVDDEEDHEEGDSALSSAPSSLSPQPGGCGQWQGNGIAREAYEAVLIEVEELQTKLLEERQELSHAKTQVRDLEKALLQETRCASRNKELAGLNRKLRETEEREASLLAELSELREQNELLEFRLLELEETSARRESPDHTADSGIVSPEPLLIKNSPNANSKHKGRAIATVIPYTSTITSINRSVSPVPSKPPLSLQESGIFEQDEDDEVARVEEPEDEEEEEYEIEVESRCTQTEVPAGELLQEVRRLQELRARIQERGAKVTGQVRPVIVPNLDQIESFEQVDPIVQLSACQERIKELEERLVSYETVEEKFLADKKISKQREEELLDENYRLTERVYWLENELRNVKESLQPRPMIDAFTWTDIIDIPRGLIMDVSTMTDDFSNEDNTKIKKEGIYDRSKAVQTDHLAPDDTIFKCLQCRNRDSRLRWSVETLNQITTKVEQCLKESVEEVAKEAREQQNWEYDETDGSITQTLGVPFNEEPIQGPGEVVESPTGTVVTLTESETDKKDQKSGTA